MSIAPVVSETDVKQSQQQAFVLFVERMGDWWVGKTIGARPHVAIIVEPAVNGRWYERDAQGCETMWGKVLEWQPPSRVLLGWQINSTFRYDPTCLTEVEITFSPLSDGGTRVRLEHRKLERFGADADRIAGLIGPGWTRILEGFQRSANP